ncbi:lysostaphin resistance A-like protein [Chloroflexota bacterium]
MESFLILLPFLVPVVVANLSERHRRSPYVTRDSGLNTAIDVGLRFMPYVLLVAINVGFLGFAALALLNQLAQMLMPEQLPPLAMVANWWALAIAASLTSILAFLPLIPPVRRWLATVLPIDPDSIVHTTALVFAIYQIGLSLGQIALIGDLENLIEAELVLTIWDVLWTGVPLVLFALVGVGLFIRRDGQGTFQRLGLRRPTWKQLILATGVTGLLLTFDYGMNLAWQEVDPAGYGVLERVTESLFGGLMTVSGAIVLGLSAGISEELLFRGAVQPRMGLLLATFLFAIGHLQYGLTLATLEVFIIGLVLGLMRNWTHTTICILIHAGYNTAGVLLGLLQP